MRFFVFYFLGIIVCLIGKFYGSVNGVEVSDFVLYVIVISIDGCVYVVMWNLLFVLVYLLKIFILLIDVVGWIYGVRKVKGVFNGFGVVGIKIKRNVVVIFDFGMFFLKIFVCLFERGCFKFYFFEIEGLIIVMNCDIFFY